MIALSKPVRAVLIALVMACGAAAHAKDAVPTELDPVAQKRAVELANELRCLVCQNQTIADSHAELAIDLRRQIDEQIKAGRSDSEIIDYMVARYGDFVLYRPPLKATTLLLWGGPALLGLIGIGVLWRVLRSRRSRQEDTPLTDAERREAERLLADARAREAS